MKLIFPRTSCLNRALWVEAGWTGMGRKVHRAVAVPWSKCISTHRVVENAVSAMYGQLLSSVLQQRRKNPQDTVYTVSRALWREQRGRDGWEQETLFHRRLSPSYPISALVQNSTAACQDLSSLPPNSSPQILYFC